MLASKLAAESVVAIDEFICQFLATIGRFAFGPPESHHSSSVVYEITAVKGDSLPSLTPLQKSSVGRSEFVLQHLQYLCEGLPQPGQNHWFRVKPHTCRSTARLFQGCLIDLLHSLHQIVHCSLRHVVQPGPPVCIQLLEILCFKGSYQLNKMPTLLSVPRGQERQGQAGPLDQQDQQLLGLKVIHHLKNATNEPSALNI